MIMMHINSSAKPFNTTQIIGFLTKQIHDYC